MEVGEDGKRAAGDVPQDGLIFFTGGMGNHCLGCIEE